MSPSVLPLKEGRRSPVLDATSRSYSPSGRSTAIRVVVSFSFAARSKYSILSIGVPAGALLRAAAR